MATKSSKKEVEGSLTESDIQEYADNFNKIVCNGFVCLAIALGNNLGLVDVLKLFDEPADATTIATTAKLNERYVKEWLGSMVAAKIVYMEGEDKYYIPSKCKTKLGMSLFAPCLPCLMNRYDMVEDMFRTGRGMDTYEDNLGKKWFEWQDKERLAFVDDRLDKGVLPVLEKHQASFKTALEVGCGSGILSTALAKRRPTANVYAIDISEDAINRAKTNAQKENVPNVEFYQYDTVKLPSEWSGKFDLVMVFDVLHDLSDPDATIVNVKRVLADDGILMLLDPKCSSYHSNNVGNTTVASYYAISIFNCLPHSLSSEPAAGLGTCWGYEREETFLKSHDLKILEMSDFTLSRSTTVFVCKKL